MRVVGAFLGEIRGKVDTESKEGRERALGPRLRTRGEGKVKREKPRGGNASWRRGWRGKRVVG